MICRNVGCDSFIYFSTYSNNLRHDAVPRPCLAFCSDVTTRLSCSGRNARQNSTYVILGPNNHVGRFGRAFLLQKGRRPADPFPLTVHRDS
jgi:hypothetical protein